MELLKDRLRERRATVTACQQSAKAVDFSHKDLPFLVCNTIWCFELSRNSLKSRCNFGIMECELNRRVLGKVPDASRNAVYEVKKGNVR
jgi:hypothetical protein